MSDNNEKLLIVSTHGPEDPEKSLIPFIVANASLAMDIETTVFLMASAVNLAVKGAVEKMEKQEGMPSILELFGHFTELGGIIKLCGPCCLHRHITGDDLIDIAEIGGAAGLVEMVMGRKTLSF